MTLVRVGRTGGHNIRHGFKVLIAWLRACTLGVALLLAAVPPTRSSTENGNETLTLILGVGSTLTLERTFDTILIDNPDVVDVRALNDRSVVLEPLNIGISNVVFVDKGKIVIANIRIVVCGARA